MKASGSSEILRDGVWRLKCRFRLGRDLGLGPKAFCSKRPGFEGSGIRLGRKLLTKEHKLGLQRAQIKDVTGTKEDGQSHQ